jgi:F-type H+-transporting ATPase subunit gamma
MSAKEIRLQINSIKNTQKITRAMEMVAGSKMWKALDRMQKGRPYAEKIIQVVRHLAKAHPEYRHFYLEQRPVKRVGFIVVTTDRGLCGGLNANLLRRALVRMKEWQDKGIEIDLCVIGQKGLNFLKRYGGNVIAHAEHLGDTPTVIDVVGLVKVMLDAYEKKELDLVILVFNRFVSTMSQKPMDIQLLPLVPAPSDQFPDYWDYIYEPDAKELLTALLKRYIEMQVYQAVVENKASEQAARMVAMKSATENAGNLIEELQLVYNKARQAAITKEIAEIIGGAAAVME